MKRVIISIVLALSAAFGASAYTELVWLNPTHDFGAFREELGPVTCVFEAVNVGKEPVTVIDARANCGCTRPTYPRTPVAPGDTLRVSVSYDPNGRPGSFRKQVKVTANTNPSSYILSVRGTVIGAPATLQTRYPVEAGRLRLSNRITPFGETTKGHVLASAINIYNPTADTITPAIGRKPGYINVLFRPEKVAPGEQTTVSLTAYTDAADGWGVIEDSLQLIPDRSHPEEVVEISTVMIVNEDFSKLSDKERAEAPVSVLSEKSVDFGRINPVDGSVTRTFTIGNTGKNPLLIRRISTPDKALAVTVSSYKVKHGGEATVTVTFDPAESEPSADMLNARITLITNDPAMPTQIIRAVGEIVR